MVGTFHHYIDGTEVEEPTGWKDIVEEVFRDLKERIIYARYPSSVTFMGSGYAVLRNGFEDALCESMTYRLTQECEQGERGIMDGVIYLTDIKWNLSKCSAETPITDTTIGATVLNNLKIPVSPTSVNSKNAVAIAAAPLIDLEVFDPSAAVGVYEPDTRIAFDWLDCIRHCVRYMTDGSCDVTSDWYDALPDDEVYCIANGVNIRTFGAGDSAPVYTFQDLYASMWKAHNLMAALEYSGTGAPILRIEQESYFWGAAGAVEFLNVDDIEQSVDTDRLYATVKLGSEGAIKNADNVLSLPYLILRGFSKEEYHLAGQCNTDNSLDLSNPFVIDTNAIENAVVNNDDANDEEVFMIQYDRSTNQAVKAPYLNNVGVPYLYNQLLQNQLVMARWEVQATGVSYFGDLTTGFQAEHTTGPQSTGPIIAFAGTVTANAGPALTFDDDSTPPNNDPGGNWNTGTNRYTAPGQGYYEWTFEGQVTVTAFTSTGTPPSFPRVGVRAVFNIYDSGSTLIYTSQVETALLPPFTPPSGAPPGNFTFALTSGAVMSATDYMEVELFYLTQTPATPPQTITVRLENGYNLRTSFVAEGGGEFNPVDPDEYHVVKLSFNKALDVDTWEGMKASYADAIGVSPDTGTPRLGYVSNIRRTLYNGETEWELLMNRKGKI